MRKTLTLLLATMLLLTAAGCRGEKDRGINRGKDIPLPADTERNPRQK